jgi:hypothetical protein
MLRHLFDLYYVALTAKKTLLKKKTNRLLREIQEVFLDFLTD